MRIGHVGIQPLRPPPARVQSLFQEATPRLLAGVGPHPPASVASAGQASCADAPRALQVGTFVPSARWRPCRASCPADRWLLPATCCTLSWPPLLLPALSCANGSRPKRLSSSGTQVGCSGAQRLRSGSRTFYRLLTLSYMDNPLGDFLHNCRTQARALVLVAELRPFLAHLTHVEAQAAIMSAGRSDYRGCGLSESTPQRTLPVPAGLPPSLPSRLP